MVLLTPWFHFSLQNDERLMFRCFTTPGLWYFVMAALGSWWVPNPISVDLGFFFACFIIFYSVMNTLLIFFFGETIKVDYLYQRILMGNISKMMAMNHQVTIPECCTWWYRWYKLLFFFKAFSCPCQFHQDSLAPHEDITDSCHHLHKAKFQPLVSGSPRGFKIKLSFKFLKNPLTFLPPAQLLNTSFHKDFGGLAVLLPLRVPCGKDPPQGFRSWACKGPAPRGIPCGPRYIRAKQGETLLPHSVLGAPEQHCWSPPVSQSPCVCSPVRETNQEA